MFPLSDWKLIKLNKDGTNAEVIESNKSKILFGTTLFCDHQIKDLDTTEKVLCEISTDIDGRVSKQFVIAWVSNGIASK